MKTSFLIFITLFYSLYIHAQLDNTGWTLMDPNQASKIIYVSTTDGNDATGTVYNYPNTALGNDPIHPTDSINSYKTIAAAMDQIDEGEAAWVLLKRGDTFSEPVLPKDGASETKPMIVSSYGDGTTLPLILPGIERGLRFKLRSQQHTWIIGLHFYANTHDPENPAYIEEQRVEAGFVLFAGDGYTTENILIEGCVFNFFRTNTLLAGENGTTRNIRLRRNLILNNYSTDSHGQGLFATNFQDLILEENTFDHNGWLIQQINGGSHQQIDGQATQFNHNIYFENVQNVTFKGNSFFRSSSIGTKWTANDAVAATSDITITNNLYHDGEIGISIGGNEGDQSYRFKNIILTDNVFTSIGLSRSTNRGIGWGIEIDDWDNGICSQNIITHQTSENVDNVYGFLIRGVNRDVSIDNNIINNLNNVIAGIYEQEPTNFENVTIKENKFRLPLEPFDFFIRTREVYTDVFQNNTYNTINDIDESTLFKIDPLNNGMSYNEWVNVTGETDADRDALAYPDPDRSLERYAIEVLKLDGLDTFYEELKKQSILNWKTEYTAPVINAWIKEGFGIESDVTIPVLPDPAVSDTSISDEPTSDDEKPLIQCIAYPNPIYDNIINIQATGKGFFRIYDMTGSLVLSSEFSKDTNTIDLSSVASGTYILKFLDETLSTIKTISCLKI